MQKKTVSKKNSVIKEKVAKSKKRIVGYDKERKELKELGEMLVNIDKYRKMGIRIPRGLVLYGEPGVGKSVMAHSIAQKGVTIVEVRAGEICSAGSEECLHESFKFAKQHAPAVLILDELDKIAGTSHMFFMQQNSDVNKILLQELDKLKDSEAVFVVATCNETHCLGDALLRPGRFDRQINVMLPDEKTRKQILKHYFSKISFKCSADYDYLAKITYQKTPADIECIVNESAIYTMHKGRNEITLDDVRHVINKMAFDGEPDDAIVDEEEAYRVAVHEAGHALVAMTLLPNSIFGASIIPQGNSKGHVEIAVSEKENQSVRDRESEITVSVAGRVAEREVLGEMYLGASSDLKKATLMANDLIIQHGTFKYSYILKAVVHYSENPISEQSQYEMECKLNELLDNADKKAAEIINGNRKVFDAIVEKLVKNKILSHEELVTINKDCA